MALKFFTSLFAALSIFTAAQAADRVSDVPRLKPFATVASDIVRIGDLVENAGKAADIAIFRSPDIGSTGSVSAAKVLEILAQHDLLIVDATGVKQVAITRDSRVISRQDIERSIIRALSSQTNPGDTGKLAITFDREPHAINVESTVRPDLEVVRAVYDPRSFRFDVAFSVPGSAAARNTPLRFIGTIRETVEVPTLNRGLNRGEIIREADVTIERRFRSDVSADAIVAPGTIVGLAARQNLRAAIPLRRSDLIRPEIVRREELVTIVYEAPGILLTSRGKALEGGGDGDLINVMNIQSKRTIQATVSGPGRVTIAPAAPATIMNTAAITPNDLSSHARYSE
jgi:flagella basal body P-ring formation protein FlgA